MSTKLASIITGLALSALLAFSLILPALPAQAQSLCGPNPDPSDPNCTYDPETGRFVDNNDPDWNPEPPKEVKAGDESVERGREDGELNSWFHTSNTWTAIWYEGFKLAYGGESVIGGPGSQANAGLLQSSGRLITQLYQPPADTTIWVADTFNSAGIATPAYAQGLGFSSLNPIFEAWKAFRNIAYIFFVIVFLAIGFMIMFRQKIGQTAVTAQQAIPKIIVALLAVSFSYAIAGVLIDIMYLLMYFIVGLFEGDDALITKSIFEVTKDLLMGGVLGTTFEASYNTVDGIFSDVGVLGNILGVIAGFSSAVVVGIAIIIAFFRLFFELLKTYITIVISVVLAPIILMMEAIPGQNTFKPWLWGLIGNLAAFPTLLLILVIYRQIIDSVGGSDAGGFNAPFLIGSGNGAALATLIGVGLLLVAETTVTQAKKTMGATGGIFDQFKSGLADSLKRGWSGGELVPGLGFTNTKNLPFGGLTGKNITGKSYVGASSLAAGVANVPGGIWREGFNRGAASSGFGRGFMSQAERSVLQTEDPTFKKWAEERKKQREEEKKKKLNRPVI